MSANLLYTKTITAAELSTVLCSFLKAVLPKLPANIKNSVHIQASSSLQALGVNVSVTADQDFETIIKNQTRELSARPYLEIPLWAITFGTIKVVYQIEKSGLGGTISITESTNQTINQKVLVVLLDNLQPVVTFSTRNEVVASSLPEAHANQLRYQQQILTELHGMSVKLTTDLATFTTESHSKMQARQSALEEEFRKRNQSSEAALLARQQELEASIKAKEDEFTKRLATREEILTKREEDLRKRTEELDLRATTVARRANQKQIRDIIEHQKSVDISLSTKRKRYIVHTLCALGTLSFGTLAAFFMSYTVASSADSFHWQYAIPMSTGLVGFASTLIYWIKWSDDWFREHARAEFANRKLLADATRAGWIVELLFEWSKEGSETMPSTVVESLTKNLFSEIESHPPTHATDSLQKFVNNLANVRVSNEGVELGAGTKSRAQPK